jgi:hypothetical protein
MSEPEVFAIVCCRTPVEYPTPGHNTVCPECGSVFELKPSECQWFAACHEPAAFDIGHLTLGDVPTCAKHKEWLEQSGYFTSDGKVPAAMPPMIAARLARNPALAAIFGHG